MPRYPKPVAPNADEIACLLRMGFTRSASYTTTTYLLAPLRLVRDAKGWLAKLDGIGGYVSGGHHCPTLTEAIAEAVDMLDPHIRALAAAHRRALTVFASIVVEAHPDEKETPCQE